MPGGKVSVRRVGDGVLLEPVRESSWPEGYFEEIRIADDLFVRSDQGELAPAPSLDS